MKSVKSEIKNKMDEHIQNILAKPSISNEDYALLRQELSEMPSDNWNPVWLPVLMMLFVNSATSW